MTNELKLPLGKAIAVLGEIADSTGGYQSLHWCLRQCLDDIDSAAQSLIAAKDARILELESAVNEQTLRYGMACERESALQSKVDRLEADKQELSMQTLADDGQWIEHTGKLQDRILELQQALEKAMEMANAEAAEVSRLSALEAGSHEPSPGLLMSMAIRFDHGLGCPGFYDSPLYARDGLTHAKRLESTLRQMRPLWEEATGHGFYRPELEVEYAARALPAPPVEVKP